MKILHITAHLGGGVGNVIYNLATKDCVNTHQILILEEPKNLKFNNLCLENNINVFIAATSDISALINESDIVQLEWWHNPTTMKFMVEFLQNISCRLIIWTHISGCNFPYIPPNIIDLAHKVVFCTPYSLDNPFWTLEEKNQVESKAEIVVSSGVNEYKTFDKVDTDKFNIGYLGNLSYNKTFKDTIVYYEEIAKQIENINFILAGDVVFGKDFVADLKQSDILKGRITFSGYVSNISDEFAKYDIMSYLLRRDSFAGSENALLEGMAYGVVPIVFDGGCESYYVKHMETGMIVNNLQEYVDAINFLYNNPNERIKMGVNSSEYIKNNLSINNTIDKLNKVYSDVIILDKEKFKFTKVFGTTPKEWFFTCFSGDINNMTTNEKASNSSGLGQYQNYFKECF